MIVSNITNKELADYLRLDFTELTDAEKSNLDVLLAAAKAFIKSYTGQDFSAVKGEVIGTGDGETKSFIVSNFPTVPGSLKAYITGTETTDFTVNCTLGYVNFTTAPALGTEITVDYEYGINACEDFAIVIYILVQDMYDNRTMYVDKGNMNKVVEMILGMHCRNLM